MIEFEDREIDINGMKWRKIKGVSYPNSYNYYKVYDQIKSGEKDPASMFRHLVRNDLFFLIYFVMKVTPANHPFVIARCCEVQHRENTGGSNLALDLWAREHFKSTIITAACPIQRILRNPERRVSVFSYAKTPAIKLLRPIKTLFEESQLLKDSFEDILYQNPEQESIKWSESEGIVVKREGFYKEASIEAHGLIDGMPTGSHFTDMIFDDIETADLVNTPESMEKVKERFENAIFLSSEGGIHQVVGTPYHWNGPLQHLRSKKFANGEQVYNVSLQPCCEGGDPDGKSVLLSEDRINLWRTSKRSFFSQGLLDPTPISDRTLNSDRIRIVKKGELPARLYKFMMVDPAGDGERRTDGRKADAWAFAVVGVEPFLDNLGMSSIYILDLCIRSMSRAEALTEIVNMYCRNGRIEKLGVEKTGMTTAETHIANALRMKGRYVSIANKLLEVLRPSGRDKKTRIADALQWPLENSKFHVLETVEEDSLLQLRLEMDKFPYWNDDGLDTISYVYDLTKNYRFSGQPQSENMEKPKRDAYDDAFGERKSSRLSWLEK